MQRTYFPVRIKEIRRGSLKVRIAAARPDLPKLLDKQLFARIPSRDWGVNYALTLLGLSFHTSGY